MTTLVSFLPPNHQMIRDDLSVLFLMALIGAMLANRFNVWTARVAWGACIVVTVASFIVAVMM